MKRGSSCYSLEGRKFATGEVALVFIKHAGGDAASPSLSAR